MSILANQLAKCAWKKKTRRGVKTCMRLGRVNNASLAYWRIGVTQTERDVGHHNGPLATGDNNARERDESMHDRKSSTRWWWWWWRKSSRAKRDDDKPLLRRVPRTPALSPSFLRTLERATLATKSTHGQLKQRNFSPSFFLLISFLPRPLPLSAQKRFSALTTFYMSAFPDNEFFFFLFFTVFFVSSRSIIKCRKNCI